MSGPPASGALWLARPRTDLATYAAASIPIALILYGDVVRQARLLVLGLLLLGFSITLLRGSELRWVWAAPIPIAVWLTWRTMSAPLADPGGLDCADAASPPAVWRLAQALLALGTLAVLMGILSVRPAAIWWRRPTVPIARLSVLGFFVAAPLGLLLSAAIARPYFGTFDLNLTDPVALVPGLVFSLSNAIGEEVIYRGAFMAFAGRVIGLRSALVIQASRVRPRPRRGAIHGLAAPGRSERGVRRLRRGAARAQDALADDADRGPYGDRSPGVRLLRVPESATPLTQRRVRHHAHTTPAG